SQVGSLDITPPGKSASSLSRIIVAHTKDNRAGGKYACPFCGNRTALSLDTTPLKGMQINLNIVIHRAPLRLPHGHDQRDPQSPLLRAVKLQHSAQPERPVRCRGAEVPTVLVKEDSASELLDFAGLLIKLRIRDDEPVLTDEVQRLFIL